MTESATGAEMPLGRRAQAKAATREMVVAAARELFAGSSYADVTLRAVAKKAGLSTGAMFVTFKNKPDLWRAAMNSEPPLDTPAVRAADQMLAALLALLDARPTDWEHGDAAQVSAWREAEAAVEAAEGRMPPNPTE